jgi:hypothetical protein
MNNDYLTIDSKKGKLLVKARLVKLDKSKSKKKK